MIFNEIYSAYYNTVAKIISAVIDGKTDDKYINKIISDNAFGESILTVLPSLKNEKWQLIHKNMTTPLKNKPTMPLTLTQQQWLKAISLDPRIKLFDVVISGLDDVEPLFTPEDYYIYDREKYINIFKKKFLVYPISVKNWSLFLLSISSNISLSNGLINLAFTIPISILCSFKFSLI